MRNNQTAIRRIRARLHTPWSDGRIPRIAQKLAALISTSLIFAVGPLHAEAQGQTTPASQVQISVDTPTDGDRVGNGTPLNVGGWAADPAGPGTGVDRVIIYLDEEMGAGSTPPLGTADYGAPRPDVAIVLGNSAFAYSGFNFTWTPTSLVPGPHTLYVYAHSPVDGWSHATVTVLLEGRVASSLTGPGVAPMRPCFGPQSGCPAPPYPPPYPPGSPCILIFPPPPGC
ncbi:MAG TPA: Ig-like domain-containing protein [Chloroflexota bacterium]|nr:Ig-like domain-containing protein [Chloroflexota bacterium]